MYYLSYTGHSAHHIQGIVKNKPTPVYETFVYIVFKNEEAKSALTSFFKNPTDVNQTTIRLVAHFPKSREFELFSRTKDEDALAKWVVYDGMLND